MATVSRNLVGHTVSLIEADTEEKYEGLVNYIKSDLTIVVLEKVKWRNAGEWKPQSGILRFHREQACPSIKIRERW